MTELSADNRRAIEFWTGPLSDDDVALAIERIITLGHPTVVAYEFLRVRLGAMMGNPDELRIEGDARVRWVETKKQLNQHAQDCLVSIGQLDVKLNTAAEALVAPGLASMGGRRISAVRYYAPNPRP